MVDDDLRLSAAHVIVEGADLADSGAAPVLAPADVRHLDRVLRLRPGQAVTVTDGAGRWRCYRWRGADGPLEADGPVVTVPRPTPAVTIGFAPVKGDRPEWTVAKLTELGVDTVIPLLADRSVVRWAGPAGAARLRRVAREAAMQSRRCHVPQILDVARPGEVAGAALAHFDGEPLSLDRPVVLVGPEGGWSPAELGGSAGCRPVSLGPLVLRAETAALAAGVLLTSLRHRTIVAWGGGRR